MLLYKHTRNGPKEHADLTIRELYNVLSHVMFEPTKLSAVDHLSQHTNFPMPSIIHLLSAS